MSMLQDVKHNNIAARDRFVTWLSGIFLLAAFLPICIEYYWQLWRKDYYRFFPVAIIAIVTLAFMRSDRQLKRRQRLGNALRLAAGVACIVTLYFSGVIRSPWIGMISFTFAVGILLDFLKDKETNESLLPLLLPFLITVRPPMNIDVRGVQYLQTLTSEMSSRVLNAMQMDHILSGNVIQPFKGTSLFVEEACSGVHSLFTLMFVAAFLGAFHRYALIRSIGLLSAAVFLALMMNCFRVSSVVIGQISMNLNLAEGIAHEIIGYLALALGIGLLLSMDRLLFFLLAPMPDGVLSYKSINYPVRYWNQIVSSSARIVEKEDLRSGRSLQFLTWRWNPLVASAFVLLVATPTYAFLGEQPNSTQMFFDSDLVSAEWLHDPQCGEFLVFEKNHRGRDSQFGETSHQWRFAKNGLNVLHSLDHTFSGWHDLTTCYRSVGWRLISTNLVTTNVDASWPVVTAAFVKPTGEHSLLCFSLFTLTGGIVLPEGEAGFLSGLEARIRQLQLSTKPTMQIQTLVALPTKLDAQTVTSIVKDHINVRSQLKHMVEMKSEHHIEGIDVEQIKTRNQP